MAHQPENGADGDAGQDQDADRVHPAASRLTRPAGFAGPQTLPLITFGIAPGETKQVPLLIGTASFRPGLGYAIPPGDWGIQATLRLGPHPRNLVKRRTPTLPLTITA